MGANDANRAQLALIGEDELPAEPRPMGRRRTGRHERALNRAAKAAGIDRAAASAAGLSLARSLACALDQAEAKGNFYAPAQLATSYQQALERLGLMGGDEDEDDGFGFSGPEVGDTPHT